MFNNITVINEVPIHAANGRVVGKVERGIFYKSIKGSKHILRIPPAIAFDIHSINEAENKGASKVEVFDQETGITYKASIEHIRSQGQEFNRGYGDQIFLALDGWVKYKQGGGLQLGLWEKLE